jgi:hypothetical protein
MWQSTQVPGGDRVDAGRAAGLVRRASPRGRLVDAAEVGRQAEVRAEEAAMARHAQLGAERAHRGGGAVARQAGRVARGRRRHGGGVEGVRAVAVDAGGAHPVADPTAHALVRAQVVRRQAGVAGRHGVVDHQRQVVAAAAVPGGRGAERRAYAGDVAAVDRVAERRERVSAGLPLRRDRGVAGGAGLHVGQLDTTRAGATGQLEQAGPVAPRRGG